MHTMVAEICRQFELSLNSLYYATLNHTMPGHLSKESLRLVVPISYHFCQGPVSHPKLIPTQLHGKIIPIYLSMRPFKVEMIFSLCGICGLDKSNLISCLCIHMSPSLWYMENADIFAYSLSYSDR